MDYPSRKPLAFGPEGTLYVISSRPTRVLRYDGNSGEFLDEFIPRGAGGLRGGQTLVFGPDGNLYIPSFWTDNVPRFDGKTGSFIDMFVTYDRKQLIGPINKSPAVRLGLIRGYLQMAVAQAQIGNDKEAERRVAQAIELASESPDEPEYWQEVVSVLVQSKMHDEAIAVLQKVTVEFPDEPEYRQKLAEIYRMLGKVHREKGDLDQSIVAYTEAIRLDPELAAAREGRGNTHLKKGEFRKAVADYDHSLELDPNNSACLNRLAWYLATGPDSRYWDVDRAVKLARKAVQLSPESSGFRHTLGVAEYRAGNWETAIEHLEKVFQMQGWRTSYDWFFLAMAHWQLGHKDEARTWYGKAVQWMEEGHSKNTELLRFRAEAAELLGVTETPPEEKDQLDKTTNERSGAAEPGEGKPSPADPQTPGP